MPNFNSLMRFSASPRWSYHLTRSLADPLRLVTMKRMLGSHGGDIDLHQNAAAMVPAMGSMPEAGAYVYRMLNPLIARFGFRFQLCRTFLEHIVRSYTHNVLNLVFFQGGLDFGRCHSCIGAETQSGFGKTMSQRRNNLLQIFDDEAGATIQTRSEPCLQRQSRIAFKPA